MVVDRKICEGPCGLPLPLEAFSINRCAQPGELGRQRLCKACTAAYNRERYRLTDGAAKKREYRKMRANLERLKIVARYTSEKGLSPNALQTILKARWKRS